MTTGNIVFFSGVGLLVLTIILCILFWIKKPQYKPESAAYEEPDNHSTQKLRNDYPTDRLSIRLEAAKQPGEGAPADGTVKLEEGTPPDGTVKLAEETVPLQETVVLKDDSTATDWLCR